MDIGKATQAILKDRVENYKFITKYKNNTGKISAVKQKTYRSRSLFKLVNYEVLGNTYTDIDDEFDFEDHFVVEKRYFNITAPEGTLVVQRFNSVTENREDADILIKQKSLDITCTDPDIDKWSYCVKMGDVNADGSVTSEEVLVVQKAVVKLVTLTEEQIMAADVNESDTVGANDAVEILDYIVKNIHSFW